METEQAIASFRNAYAALRAEIGKVIVGQEDIVDSTVIALFAGGHVLLEGVPGLGKTLLVRTLSEVLDLSFNRIQFTPDLMPADILGTNLVMATHPKTDSAAAVASQYLRFGSSPRGAQTLILAGKVRALTQGRFNVSFEDIQSAALPAMRHRLIPNFEAEAEGITTDHIVEQILRDVPVSAEAVNA